MSFWPFSLKTSSSSLTDEGVSMVSSAEESIKLSSSVSKEVSETAGFSAGACGHAKLNQFNHYRVRDRYRILLLNTEIPTKSGVVGIGSVTVGYRNFGISTLHLYSHFTVTLLSRTVQKQLGLLEHCSSTFLVTHQRSITKLSSSLRSFAIFFLGQMRRCSFQETTVLLRN